MTAPRRPQDLYQERTDFRWSKDFGPSLMLAAFDHPENADGGSVSKKVMYAHDRHVVTGVRYVNPTGLAAHNDNFATLSVLQAAVVVATQLTDANGGGISLGVNTYHELPLAAAQADRIVEAGEELACVVAEAGTTTVPPGRFEIWGKAIPDDVLFMLRRCLRSQRIDRVDLKLKDGLAADNTNYYTFLFGALTPLVVADFTFTAEADDDLITKTAHGLLTGDGPIRVANAGGGLPGALVAATDYWVIRNNANTFKLATSLNNALAGVAINISSDGTGTQTLSDTASTKRVQTIAEYDTRAANEGALTADTFGAMDLTDTVADLVVDAGDIFFLHCSEAGDAVLSDLELTVHARYI